jgi:TolB-like protein/DNA-binding winged helix-turn-helix (wHTH) protein/tetratricopeptide (TPR) repeat protein
VNSDFRVGPWLVRPSLNTISQNGTSNRVEPKMMGVLVCLAEHAGEVVPKEKLLQVVWPDTFVSDDVLKRSVSELRHVFGDDAHESRIIETIPRRGYRLLVAVTPTNGQVLDHLATRQATHTETLQARPSTGKWNVGLFTIGIAVPIGLLLAFNIFGSRDRVFRDGGPPLIRSLAVVPLQNLSGDPSQEYFADGMTEELITELSRLSGLKVISRTSTTRYRNTDKSLPQIAHELNVDAIVEGSVLRSGDGVRITAQLHTASDASLWAGAFERNLQDVLALQSTVARTIADQIRVEITPTERARLQAPRPISPAALEAYLQGEYHGRRFGTGSGPDERYKAAQYFREAIRSDPNFARAYVALACTYITNVAPSSQEAPLVKDALEKALAADPDLSDAHLWMARFREYHEWDFAAAEQEFRRAIDLDRNNAQAHDFYGDYLENLGRQQEAAREEGLAQELDPGNDHLIDGFFARGEYPRALEMARNDVKMHPNDGACHWGLYRACLRTGSFHEAIQELQQVVTLYGYPNLSGPLAKADATAGYRGALGVWAEDLIRLQGKGTPASPTMIAEVYVYLGDRKHAFEWLEKGFKERDGFLVGLKDPVWQPLRSDPQFQDLVRRVGLPQ